LGETEDKGAREKERKGRQRDIERGGEIREGNNSYLMIKLMLLLFL
jgi:hypothetical protein